VNTDQSAVILRVLRQLDKVLTADDKPLAAAYVKAKAWDAGQAQMSTEELRRAFARRTGLRMLLDLNQLKKAIRDGAKQGIWIYYDPQERVDYGPLSPAPLVQIDEDTLLYIFSSLFVAEGSDTGEFSPVSRRGCAAIPRQPRCTRRKGRPEKGTEILSPLFKGVLAGGMGVRAPMNQTRPLQAPTTTTHLWLGCGLHELDQAGWQ
jgi:hypothetical protein